MDQLSAVWTPETVDVLSVAGTPEPKGQLSVDGTPEPIDQLQSNLNGSNIFGTIEIRSRHG